MIDTRKSGKRREGHWTFVGVLRDKLGVITHLLRADRDSHPVQAEAVPIVKLPDQIRRSLNKWGMG